AARARRDHVRRAGAGRARARAGGQDGTPAGARRFVRARAAALGRALVDRRRPRRLRPRASRGVRAAARARRRRARRSLRTRLVGARARGRDDGARARRLGRGLPDAPAPRAGARARARRPHEQLARQRARPARRRAARARAAARPARGRRPPRRRLVRDRRRRGARDGAGHVPWDRDRRARPGDRSADRDEGRRGARRRRRLRVLARRPHESPRRLPARRLRTHRLARHAAGRTVIAGVAAGHPATAQAGLEILEDGGSAADAAVAASLASCVAETVMTGLLGGGHAIHYDAAAREVRNLDCFCAVPGVGAEPREPDLVRLEVPFGEELVHYAVGPASCAVPGVPAGLGALWDAYGRLPWRRLVEPALALARVGVEMPEAHIACLAMLEPVMTMREGGRMYAPGGVLLRTGDRLEQPGLVAALESLQDEGAAGAYRGTIGRALVDLSRERG